MIGGEKCRESPASIRAPPVFQPVFCAFPGSPSLPPPPPPRGRVIHALLGAHVFAAKVARLVCSTTYIPPPPKILVFTRSTCACPISAAECVQMSTAKSFPICAFDGHVINGLKISLSSTKYRQKPMAGGKFFGIYYSRLDDLIVLLISFSSSFSNTCKHRIPSV